MIPRRSSISKNRISCKIVTPKAIDMLLISLYRTATLCICETYGHDLNLWVFVLPRGYWRKDKCLVYFTGRSVKDLTLIYFTTEYYRLGSFFLFLPFERIRLQGIVSMSRIFSLVYINNVVISHYVLLQWVAIMGQASLTGRISSAQIYIYILLYK